MSRLCQPRTTKERFRLPFDEETAAKLLKCAIAGEVSRFGGTFLYPDAVDSQVRNLAASLTSGRRCGVMLCGLCGNGKTTVMRAFQNLLNVIRIPDSYHRTVYGMPIVNAVHIAHLCRNSYIEFLRLCDMEMLGIDDMGIEPVEVQEFGNMHRPLTDLLARRYENRGFSFITTNLVPQQIRKLYGEGRIKADRNRMQKTFSFVQLSGTPLAPVCFGCGKRTDGLTWSGSVQLRGMPRYYRLRTVIPRRPRNSPADCCPCRSQARIIPLLETVSRLFKDICYIWNTKIPPVRSMSKRSSL